MKVPLCFRLFALLFVFPVTFFAHQDLDRTQGYNALSGELVEAHALDSFAKNKTSQELYDKHREAFKIVNARQTSGATPPGITSAGEVSPLNNSSLPSLPAFLERDQTVRAAYLDAMSILSEDNSCSRFFGGSQSIVALDGLARRLRRTSLNDRSIGIQMQGGYETFLNYQTGFSYRLFERAVINSDGPFYDVVKIKHPPKNVGGFGSHTREARALMLLHELAHLVKKPDSPEWLIMDDGGDAELSEANTSTISQTCRSQLLALH